MGEVITDIEIMNQWIYLFLGHLFPEIDFMDSSVLRLTTHTVRYTKHFNRAIVPLLQYLLKIK
jgi:hypothetical protein